MGEAITLHHGEIIEITKKKRFSAQIRALESLRIPFKLRLDGSPCVFREAAKQYMGVSTSGEKSSDVKLNLEKI